MGVRFHRGPAGSALTCAPVVSVLSPVRIEKAQKINLAVVFGGAGDEASVGRPAREES
jgi:hypothetical protein